MAQHATTQTAGTRPRGSIEDDIRVIKGWVIFMGIVTLLPLIGSVISAMVLVAGIHSIQQGQQAGTSACVSQGGTIPGC